MERVVKQLEKWEVQDTTTIAKALDKIIQNIEKAAAKEGTKALARANAKERAEATVSKVDLPSFMEEARWGVLRLFQDHFLVGTVNGKAALQWLLQVLTPPAGHDFVQQWEARMGPFLGYVLFAYKQHYSEAEQATAADKLSLHAGNDFYLQTVEVAERRAPAELGRACVPTLAARLARSRAAPLREGAARRVHSAAARQR